MRRPLVLSDETARHAFRQRLPRHIAIEPVPAWRAPMSDRQLFLLTFAAGFMAFYGFLL